MASAAEMMSDSGWQGMQSKFIFFGTVLFAAISIATVAQDEKDTHKNINEAKPSSEGSGTKTDNKQLTDAERAKRISESDRPIEEQFFGDSKGPDYLPVGI